MESDVPLRFSPWDQSKQEALWEVERLDKIDAANQRRPRFHQREMHAEEARQRHVIRKTIERQEAFEWLVNSVREGRIMLLKKARCTGLDKEARLLWTKQAKTVPAKHVLNEVWNKR